MTKNTHIKTGCKIEKKCSYCGKIIIRYESRFRYKLQFCSNKCSSDYRKTHTCENQLKFVTGRKLSKQEIEQRAQTRKRNGWNKNPEKTKLLQRNARLGKKNSLLHRINMSLCQTGEKIFTGFKTPLKNNIRHSKKYFEWRLKIFKRDNFTCQHCDIRGGYLEAHHIIPFSTLLTEYDIISSDRALKCKPLWDINNGITLCRKCHNKTKKGRIKNDED